MKTKIFTLLSALTISVFMGHAQRITNFALDGVTALGSFAAFNPTNDNASNPGDLQIVFPFGTDLSNKTAIITCSANTSVITDPMPTDWTVQQTGIQVQQSSEPAVNAWYNITCKIVNPATLPFTLKTEVESGNFADTWTSATIGWAAACAQNKQKNCRFGNPNTNLIVAFSDTPDSLFFNINGASDVIPEGNIFDVEESADGVTWTTVIQYTNLNMPGSKVSAAEKAQKFKLLSTTRFIRWQFTNRANSLNVSLTGDLVVTKLADTGTNHTSKLSAETSIYPIPATDVLNINGKTAFAKAIVCNLAGQSVATHLQPNHQINISNLPQGIYMINLITTDGEKITKRFVKQ